ncbi:dihydrofolate reductase [Peptostreptococcus sp. MV1]|uniref:dihydrofolate reductase n=1 Tax=Peptostreptococcus sp. MV1 TaxID=1219626 RepID=UPI00050EE6AD|nr:dihydrofolate reductase [Peptostreptococcus sp. MV1]KGF14384.1 dihydrofolate reductase [Peptostreptococcus sp. MV1]
MINNIYMIVAMTKNTRAIGIDGGMLYHLKEDLKYFKETTLNHTIVCGRKTYFSFPKRPLPNRKNIILTRGSDDYENAYSLHSKDEVIKYALDNPNEDIFICGGDNVYKQFMDIASRLYITEIDEDQPVQADSFFPEIDRDIWTEVSRSDYIVPEKAPRYRFLVYNRLK